MRRCHSGLLLVCMIVVVSCLQVFGEEAATDESRTLTTADIEQWMQTLSNWGRWGEEDELGALNLITPTKRKQAAALVRDGVSVSLAHESVKDAIDDSEPFEHTVTINNAAIGSAGDTYSVQYHGFTQTHMDALSHLFYKGKLYNGYLSSRITPQGCPKLGVQNFRHGIFTKAVLVDMPRLLGVKFLKGDQAIYQEHLEAWEKQTGVRVESGDALLIHTGRWTRREIEGPWSILESSAGLHASCLPWLKDRDIAVVASDLCLDLVPSRVEGFTMPVHWVVVTAMGVPILDNCDFKEVAREAEKRNRWEFLLTVAPLVVPGGTGSPVNPIATF